MISTTCCVAPATCHDWILDILLLGRRRCRVQDEEQPATVTPNSTASETRTAATGSAKHSNALCRLLISQYLRASSDSRVAEVRRNTRECKGEAHNSKLVPLRPELRIPQALR